MLIESVAAGSGLQLAVPTLAERVGAGEILVIRGLLQEIGWFDELLQIFHRDLGEIVGSGRAGEVIATRLEHIHEQLSVAELFEFNRTVMRALAPLAPGLIRDFAHRVLKRRGTFAECYANVRTIVPYDTAAQHVSAFAAEHRLRGAGKVTLHGPHYDSWHRHPLNMINLWCAIGHVRNGNGMLVYPDVLGKRLPADFTGRIRRDQMLGRPVNFGLDPGDGVIFAGNHLHGSELNVTGETRCVISLRMTLERPDFPDTHAYRYVYSDWIGTRLERCARLRVQLSRSFLLDRAKRLLAARRGERPGPVTFVVGPQRRFQPDHDTSKRTPRPVEIAWDEARGTAVMAADAVPVAAILPVDDQFCVLRTESGYRLVGRSCPHEGADMAGATVLSDGKLVCPWHNLHFHTDTGASPCSRVAKLAVVQGVVDGPAVRFVLPPELSTRAR